MPSASCEVLPPFSATPLEGGVVYRCEGVATAMNDTDSDIYYNVSLIMTDSAGHRVDCNVANVVASAGGSSSSGPYVADLAADLYSSGDVVTFTCQMSLTAAFNTTDRKTNTLTIP